MTYLGIDIGTSGVKALLIAEGLWSQYLEVGIGPEAEVFTKAPPMAAVGTGAQVGLHPASHWNNPEPELVLAVDAAGRVRGVTLGNDVNLRDIEGRSALLLGKAKDNNASCAIGPFVRLFDEGFGIEFIEVFRGFAGSDDSDGQLQLAGNGEHDAALGRAVQLGQNNAGYTESFVEQAGLLQGVLPLAGVEDEQYFVRSARIDPAHHALHLLQLLHQVGLRMQSARGVGEQHIDFA